MVVLCFVLYPCRGFTLNCGAFKWTAELEIKFDQTRQQVSLTVFQIKVCFISGLQPFLYLILQYYLLSLTFCNYYQSSSSLSWYHGGINKFPLHYCCGQEECVSLECTHLHSTHNNISLTYILIEQQLFFYYCYYHAFDITFKHKRVSQWISAVIWYFICPTLTKMACMICMNWLVGMQCTLMKLAVPTFWYSPPEVRFLWVSWSIMDKYL